MLDKSSVYVLAEGMYWTKVTYQISTFRTFYCLSEGSVWGGQCGICWWTRNEDFQYGISRFWEKNGRETIFPALEGAGNYWKK